MNKKRELMASVTTQTQASGSMVLNEYNMYNLALGLYGTEGVFHQTGTNLVSSPYTVPSVPGIIELRDPDGNRYANVTNVVVAPANSIPASATFNAAANVSVDGTVYTDTLGGTITLNGVGYTGTENATYILDINDAPTNAGDLDGFTVSVASNVIQMEQNPVQATGQNGLDTLVLTIDGITITFNVDATSSFTATPDNTFITINVTAATTAYVEGRDYVIEDESIRAGLIKIKKNGSISSGDTVLVSATIPEADFVTVSGASAGKIEGSLLFSGDPNQGNALMIEAWKVSIRPKFCWAYAA